MKADDCDFQLTAWVSFVNLASFVVIALVFIHQAHEGSQRNHSSGKIDN
jgi:hypothetical protein